MTTTDHYSYATDLTPDDYRQFYAVICRRQAEKRPKWIYPLVLIFSFPVALVLTYFTSDRNLQIDPSYVLAFVLGTFAMNVAVLVIQSGVLRWMSVVEAEDWKRFSVKLDDDGVVACGDGIMMKWQWSTVKDVTVEGEAVMIWSGRLQAIRIPGRAFADAAARDAVVALVRSRITT
jgi:hypothetical protein